MSKKKKIPKLTDEQYYAYIMGLKDNTAALFDANGNVVVPDAFTAENKEKKQGE